MLDVARSVLGDQAEELRQLTLPDDTLPEADAIVAIGHAISYLADADAVDRALGRHCESAPPRWVARHRYLRPGMGQGSRECTQPGEIRSHSVVTPATAGSTLVQPPDQSHFGVPAPPP